MHTVDFELLDIQPGMRVLDLGCGEGRHSVGAHFLYPAAEVIGVDISSEDVRTARQKLMHYPSSHPAHCQLLVADGQQLPFAEHSFDRIICSEVLEHIPHYDGFLQEINRLLKPGGLFAVSVPRSWPEQICWRLSSAYHDVDGGHIRIFQAKQLRQEIEKYNMAFQRRHWAHALHTPFWWLRCLFWQRGENFWPVRQYHRLLVWDLMQKPWLTQTLERVLNPLLGKSVVMYFRKEK